MSTQPVRIGIVGAGRFSRARVIPELKKVPGVELVAIANSSRESSERVAAELGVKRVAADWAEVVSSPDVDLVYNGTQAPQHRDVLMAALEANKHVLTLNPLSMTAAEGRELVAAANARPHLKARDYLAFPHGPYTREDALVLQILASGEIGTVRQATFAWYTPFLAAGSYFEVLNRWLGTHKRILAVRKQDEVDGKRLSAATVIAELASGALVTYAHSTYVTEGARTPRVEIHGDAGTLIVHAQPTGRDSVFIVKNGSKSPEPVSIPQRLAAFWDDPRFVPVEAQFVEWLRGGPEPSPVLLKFEEGMRNLEFAEAFVASSRQGGVWVDMPVH
ncbi:MAG: Gfo/Idh/MocA family oxidoreductase [Chloroflexi bacterium]|nr:Gfo/Idh/MocA family oxidoreductase [Chloroflexota bacterium]